VEGADYLRLTTMLGYSAGDPAELPCCHLVCYYSNATGSKPVQLRCACSLIALPLLRQDMVSG
jgi:hypothetical protein